MPKYQKVFFIFLRKDKIFILLYKSKKQSSFKCINNYAKNNNINKIGHTGTLDPIATGLLLVATDDDTKLIDYIDKGFKTYVATAKLGFRTMSFDTETKVIDTKDFSHVTKTILEKTLTSFLGTSFQIPPIYSAKKIDGKRAYKLAREGKIPTMKKTKIKISKIKLLNFEKEGFSFEVIVSRGTFIRSLINDIGLKLNTFAIMTELKRTKIGNLKIEDLNKVINIEPLFNIPIMKLNIDKVLKLRKGFSINVNKSKGNYILKYKNDYIGIGNSQGNILKSKKIFGRRIEKIVGENV